MESNAEQARNDNDGDGFTEEKQDHQRVEGLEGIAGKEVCLHLPDNLCPIGLDFDGDRIIQRFQCSCGRQIDEIFTLSHTRGA